MCVYLDLLQQSLYDAQQDVPGDNLQLFAVLLDKSGDWEDDFIGHHLIGTWHGLRAEMRQQQSQQLIYSSIKHSSVSSNYAPVIAHVSLLIIC